MFRKIVPSLWAGVVVAMTGSVAIAAEHEGESVSLNPLSWQYIQQDLAIWTAVVFLCLLAILWKFAWKPIAQGLEKREQGIADQIAQAEGANQQAKELLAEHERKLAAAGDEVRGILDQGRRQAEQLGREMLDKAKQEAKTEHERALKQIDAAASAAVKDIADQSAAMAIELAGKIVRTELKARDHAKLIEQAVAGFVHGEEKASQN
ncbi:MAG: F0F1 ATP synthase subunit B [Planctomycetaceae bacterium]|nr:F0F1 ATP synthase subunit B [Planctomycetaceae bacterium]